MVLKQLAFLSHAQAFQVGPQGQEVGPQGQETGCANVKTELVFCTVTKQDAYWLLAQDQRLMAKEKAEFECDRIPHYHLKGEKASFTCSEDGVLHKTGCPCLTVGRQDKTSQVKFGDFESLGNSENYWLNVCCRRFDTDLNVEIYTAKVKESPTLQFEFRVASKKNDSIIYNVTPDQCMQICLYHNKWAQENDPGKGCSVAVPRKLLKSQAGDHYFPQYFLTEDEDQIENTCWLRYTESEELANIVDDRRKSPYSYDLTCTVDELNKQQNLSDVPTWLQEPPVTPVYS